ncbi:MAG: oxaloacetate decarboxylase [Deltaproteobacteria bacterium]|nr:oxaloacetate decarboxylase [Deltaproteobacteria bacterium]MBW1994365.1 oxaloacetate decarboxylase [Deltaproteobacteria bacterium]MBW2154750.1 oxaloacetate decarboxylase [Deltaproteobacteria bacterium]
MNGAKSFRQLLKSPELIIAPGAYDCISARLIEAAGFPAVYITGAGVASSRLGRPDIGLTTMTEILDTARNIVNATNIPVICDADTGYGNPINLIRTTEEFEQAGVAAIQVEDQVTPKRCGHTEGKQLISKAEMVKKIEAFQYAKRNDDFSIIARTDAIAVNGFDDAIDRARAYAEAGADVLFVEAPRTVEEMKQVVDLLHNTPLLINIVDGGGATPVLSTKELESMGFKIAIYPASPWMAAIKGIQQVLEELRINGTTVGFSERMVSFQEMFEIVGLSHYKSLEKRFMAVD